MGKLAFHLSHLAFHDTQLQSAHSGLNQGPNGGISLLAPGFKMILSPNLLSYTLTPSV